MRRNSIKGKRAHAFSRLAATWGNIMQACIATSILCSQPDSVADKGKPLVCVRGQTFHTVCLIEKASALLRLF